MQVGVDIGGTFTDFALAEDGGIRILKVLSTPRDPAEAMLNGLTTLLSETCSSVDRITHGSTVATNAVLERKGARTALITTQGFRDILAIGRQHRPELYALQPRLPDPLIPRRWCYEIPERLDHEGRILTPLDLNALDAVLEDIESQDVESLAVCLLYSYVNPVHELQIRDRILGRGRFAPRQIALSSQVLPEFREYERASTVALEAYVRPVVGRYLHRLEGALCPALSRSESRGESHGADERRAGEKQPVALPGVAADLSLLIMKSDGGLMSVARAQDRAIHTALSGPAAGVIGAFRLAQLAGYDNVISLDIGGTSTDVALCPGALVRRSESQIGELPLRTRVLDVETIGAGGGSIARLDAGGVLRVGPQSAGADPGPIVYGLGGEEVTVTDAHAVLGRVDPGHFLGGKMTLHVEAGVTALGCLGEAMGLTPEEAALGVVEVANANIERALRRVSVARGYDPRRFTLVAFGGAGPLHACAVADRLRIPRVLVPRHPGVLCALGMLMADLVVEESRSVLQPVSAETVKALESELDDMALRAWRWLVEEGMSEKAIIVRRLVDARYAGQSYELTIPLVQELETAFHAAHADRYGHRMPERTVEVVNLRVQAVGLVDGPELQAMPLTEDDGSSALLGHRNVLIGGVDDRDQERGQMSRMAVYEREGLHPGAAIEGPALVVQMDSTAFVAPGWRARMDGHRNLVLEGQAVLASKRGQLPQRG